MPIYDYVCTNCGERTEVMHAVDALGPSECRICGGPMRKALSPPAIVFKGSGWAKKDARSATSSSTRDDTDKPTPAAKSDAAGKSTTKEAAGSPSD